MASGRLAVGSNDPLALGAIFDLMILTPTFKAALEDESLLRPTGCVATIGVLPTTSIAFSSTLATALAIHLFDGIDDIQHLWNPTIGRQGYCGCRLRGLPVTWFVISRGCIDLAAKSASWRLRISHLV